MNNFDSLTLKFFVDENKIFFENAVVQKIQQPSKRELVLSLRNFGKVQKFYINIQPQFAHICLKNKTPNVPKNAPMFCMLLRKYLTGARIVEFKNVEYERILEIYFNSYDEIGSQYRLCLAVELMGKHSNIILYNSKTQDIIGCAHNISPEKSSVRELYGGIKYIYPPKQNKNDILKTSYGAFFATLKDNWVEDVNKNYYYLTKPIIEIAHTSDPLVFFQNLQNIAKNGTKEIFGKGETINDVVCDYFSKYLFEDEIEKLRNQLAKIAKKELGKITFLKSDNKCEKYKKAGEYILSNMHDENLIKATVELDKTLSLSENAQKYFKLYQKEKTAQSHREIQQKQNQENKKYFEEILFQINSAQTIEELNEIKEILLPDKLPQKIEPKIESVEFEGWKIFIGKNSKQNDYLISKIAHAQDYWFHALNYPSSHIILKHKTSEPDARILEFCANLTKENSPLKNSGKASIIYTQRKYLKKPPCAKLGYVTYEKEKEIVI